ncbi:MAG: aminotransferase class I/II-fold pyridoxal phosphate-dependent enzyme [Pseudobdellovibrio sp.]
MDKQIRAKRYKVKSENNLKLIVDYMNGDIISFDVVECSQNGLRCYTDYNFSEEDKNNLNAIMSASKLTWESKEYSLGRLVLRRLITVEKGFELAFSTVDIKVPITSHLSKILDINLELEDSGHTEELSVDRFSLAHFVETEYTNVDLFDRMRKFDVFRSEWERSKKYGYKTVREASKGERVTLSRQRKGNRKDYIVMGSNDYLGLGSHAEVVKAAQNAMDLYGFGSTGSPVTTGTTDLHNELCNQLAKIHKKEAAILFNSGYAANIGIIPAVTSANDLIIADMLCHASIQDAMQMSKATSRFFKHNDVAHLESILQKERQHYNGCLVVTEGVFSMDGDTAKLDEIFYIARKYNCRIMVDQAHCFGVIGANGLGICEKFNLLRETDIIMGTFSKICGGIGGFATGSQELIEWLRHFSRAQIFSVSLPPSTVAAVSKSLDLFINDKEIIKKLHTNIKHFVKNLESLGYKFNSDHESAVIPVVVGDEKKLGEMYQSLLDDGVLCIPIVYPAVSRKNCRFRFTVMATHSKSDLDYATACLEKAMIKANFSFNNPSREENSFKKKVA